MKEQFITYLKSIGMTQIFVNRVDEICQFYENILKTKLDDEIIDIFVTDYITKEEKREYENLYLFSKKFFMEAKLFITQDDFDMLPISENITYLKITKQNYDFMVSSEKSRLNVHFVSGMSGGDLKASGENCNYLKEIYFKYMLSKLIA